jgi:hypothetical protein
VEDEKTEQESQALFGAKTFPAKPLGGAVRSGTTAFAQPTDKGEEYMYITIYMCTI